MTTHQSTAPTAAASHVDPVTGLIPWGSKLTPEERAWQITKLLPVVLGALESLADDAPDPAAGKDAAGQLVR